jgi:hypothetical protein
VIESENYGIMTEQELDRRLRESLDQMQAIGVLLVDPEPPDPKKGDYALCKLTHVSDAMPVSW